MGHPIIGRRLRHIPNRIQIAAIENLINQIATNHRRHHNAITAAQPTTAAVIAHRVAIRSIANAVAAVTAAVAAKVETSHPRIAKTETFPKKTNQ